jgi:sensor c-di-GMP phosphodiesterase-like protein
MYLLIHLVRTRFCLDQNQIYQRRITPSIAEFARALEFDIVAEGFEEDLQMIALCELGYLYGQSFQIS